ncbi:hypothetical protein BaRGS_00034501, partial [Batillaria attramentaria]
IITAFLSPRNSPSISTYEVEIPDHSTLTSPKVKPMTGGECIRLRAVCSPLSKGISNEPNTHETVHHELFKLWPVSGRTEQTTQRATLSSFKQNVRVLAGTGT